MIFSKKYNFLGTESQMKDFFNSSEQEIDAKEFDKIQIEYYPTLFEPYQYLMDNFDINTLSKKFNDVDLLDYGIFLILQYGEFEQPFNNLKRAVVLNAIVAEFMEDSGYPINLYDPYIPNYNNLNSLKNQINEYVQQING